MKFGLYILIIEFGFKFPVLVEYGWGIGYVLLPYNHPFWGKDYDDISIDVHGGLTFGGKFDFERFEKWLGNRQFFGDVNLKNYKRFDNYWMIGFDTAHYGDNPSDQSKDFVLKETNYLLEQCLDDNIEGIEKYKSIYLRKDKLKKLDAPII